MEIAGSGSWAVTYSCVQGGAPGGGNIDGNPLFVDTSNGDYRLRDGSPCIDRGTDVGLPYERTAPDMGASEAPAEYGQAPTPKHMPSLVYVDRTNAPGGDGSSWGKAFNTITAALDVAGTSDEIWIAQGTYPENIFLEPTVSIYGGFAGTETQRAARDWVTNETILDATGLRTHTAVGADDTTLDGVRLTGGSAYYGGGVYCDENSSPTLTNCTIAENSANDGGGVCCFHSSATLTDCTIHGNLANDRGGGVFGDNSSPTLTNCTINGNSADRGGGVYCDNSSPTLINCTIAGNEAGYGSGVHWFYSSPTLTNCILWNRGTEIAGTGSWIVTYTCVQGGAPGEGNIDGNPLFVDASNGDYRLSDGSPCIDRGTDVGLPQEGTAPDIGAWETPASCGQAPNPNHTPSFVYVDRAGAPGGDGSSWGEAFNTITAALDVAGTADEIWVAQGTYPENIFLEPTVSIYGGFAGTETRRAARDWVANETIIDATGIGPHTVVGVDNATLDGFTITGGSADVGAGVFCSHASPTLTNCTISGNSAGDGGGVYCDNSSPTLTNCSIAGNTAEDNGGGVYCWESSPRLSNCAITDNSADDRGGGVCCDGFSPTLTNCTLRGNSADYGGGMCCYFSSPTLTNCILWADSPDEIYVWAASPHVVYSDIQGGWTGEGNIDEDPLFVDPEGGDFTLRSDSPCIDTGSPNASLSDGCLPPGLGTARNDMGAYGGPGNCGWENFNPPPTPTPRPSPTPTRTPFVRSDVNNDLKVDADDLLCALRDWHESAQIYFHHRDWSVDSLDLAAFVSCWHETTGP